MNGQLVQSTDNMFLPYRVEAPWWIAGQGQENDPSIRNEIVVHIKPAVLEVRKYPIPVASNCQKYNMPSLYARKAASMYGWDIMPRIVSAGLWKDVTFKKKKPDKINEFYLAVNKVDLEKNTADVRLYINVDTSVMSLKEYTVKVEGRCGNACFTTEEQLWHTSHAWNLQIKDCKFWWPKNAGAPKLYDTTVTLIRGEEICDSYTCKLGIRTVELERTDTTDRDGNGKFGFKVNGKPVFATEAKALDAHIAQAEWY